MLYGREKNSIPTVKLFQLSITGLAVSLLSHTDFQAETRNFQSMIKGMVERVRKEKDKR